jgi:Retrotransposon gag protein
MDVEQSPPPGSPAASQAQLQAVSAEGTAAIATANASAEALARHIQAEASQTYATLKAQCEQEIAYVRAQAAMAASNASARAAAVATSAVSHGSNLAQARLLEKPKRFSGERKRDAPTLHTWLFTVESFLAMLDQPQERWSRIAGTFLEGSAQLWHEGRTKGNLVDMNDWELFKKDIAAHFEPVNSQKVARDALARLTQRTSAPQYCADFMHQFLRIPNMGQDDAIDVLVRGLKPNIRIEVDLRESGEWRPRTGVVGG